LSLPFSLSILVASVPNSVITGIVTDQVGRCA
jgi:hypothetical protein